MTPLAIRVPLTPVPPSALIALLASSPMSLLSLLLVLQDLVHSLLLIQPSTFSPSTKTQSSILLPT